MVSSSTDREIGSIKPNALVGGTKNCVEALKGAVNEIEAFATWRAEIVDNKAAVDSAGSATYHGVEGTRPKLSVRIT